MRGATVVAAGSPVFAVQILLVKVEYREPRRRELVEVLHGADAGDALGVSQSESSGCEEAFSEKGKPRDVISGIQAQRTRPHERVPDGDIEGETGDPRTSNC